MDRKIPLLVILVGFAILVGLWAVIATAGDGTVKFWEWQSTSWQSVSVAITGWMLAIFASLTWSSMRTQETTRHREQFALRRNELAVQTLRVRDLAYDYLIALKSQSFEIDNAGAPSSEEFQPTLSRIRERLDRDIADMTEKSARFEQSFVESRGLNTDNVSAADEDAIFGEITILHALEADIRAQIKGQSELVEVMKYFWRVPDQDSI